jgi:integrase
VGSGGLEVASVHKKGDGWVVRWRNHGDPKNHSAPAPTRAIADTIRLNADSARALGKPYLGPKAEAAALAARRVDLRELAREYLRARKRAGKAAGTIYQTNIALTLFLQTLSEDDETPIAGAELTTKALAGYYDHLVNDRDCSLGTARARVEYVQRWWAWLCDEGGYDDRLPRPRTIEMAEPPRRPDPVAPTWEEMDRAIACASGWYQQLMLACRFTGLRANDQAMQLRRTDLDPAAGILRIRPELGKTPNEKRGRAVPVSRHLLAMVATWPEDPDGWLIHVPPNVGRWEGPAKRTAWNDAASAAWMRAGVRPEVWDTQESEDGQRRNGHPLHCFRAGVITHLQALGAALPDVQYLVGHKLTGGVTVERYTDPAAVRKLREAVDLIPPLTLVEVRRIQGGGVVWVGIEQEGPRYLRPG